MWQKCPICNGEGRIPGFGTALYDTCPTCNGKRIISCITGLPIFSEEENKKENNNGDLASKFFDNITHT